MLAPNPPFLRLAPLAVLLGAAAFSPGGRASAASLSEARCSITLAKVSYDDPGTDNAEFLELRVERAERGPPPRDGGADAAAPGEGGRFTLGHCGLAAVELVDGVSGACTVYRTIPLAEVAVPEDGVVVLCAADAPFAGSCDVTAAGTTALKAGWLQNGPHDGVRLRGIAGDAAEIGYTPPPACFSAGVPLLADESGELASAGEGIDDVSVLCDGRYVLLGASEARLRADPACPRPHPAPSAGGPDGSVEGGAPVSPHGPSLPAVADASAPAVSGEAGYVPEYAPVPRPSPSADDPLFRTDAGARGFPDLRPPPTPPGCAMERAADARRAPVGALLAGLVICRVVRRRRRRFRESRSVLRAGSAARCGWWPSR